MMVRCWVQFGLDRKTERQRAFAIAFTSRAASESGGLFVPLSAKFLSLLLAGADVFNLQLYLRALENVILQRVGNVEGALRLDVAH